MRYKAGWSGGGDTHNEVSRLSSWGTAIIRFEASHWNLATGTNHNAYPQDCFASRMQFKQHWKVQTLYRKSLDLAGSGLARFQMCNTKANQVSVQGFNLTFLRAQTCPDSSEPILGYPWLYECKRTRFSTLRAEGQCAKVLQHEAWSHQFKERTFGFKIHCDASTIHKPPTQVHCLHPKPNNKSLDPLKLLGPEDRKIHWSISTLVMTNTDATHRSKATFSGDQLSILFIPRLWIKNLEWSFATKGDLKQNATPLLLWPSVVFTYCATTYYAVQTTHTAKAAMEFFGHFPSSKGTWAMLLPKKQRGAFLLEPNHQCMRSPQASYFARY